jgi:ATP-dependent Clp protease adaptor protein ClpS
MAKQDKAAMNNPNAQQSTVAAPEATRPRHLPQYRVILHNDPTNTFDHVIETIVMLTPLKKEDALRCTDEADKTGTALVLVVHRRAELYVEQFHSRNLTVTIEPTE